MFYPRSHFGVVPWAAVLLVVCCCCLSPAYARRCRVGIAGEHVTGYNGLLARMGLPREILLDYQLSDPDVLGRYDLLLVSSLNGNALPKAMEPILDYVRQGGRALLDSNALPPSAVVPGVRAAFKKPPRVQFAGTDNPLVKLLGGPMTFACPGGTHFLDPEGMSEIRVLARFEGQANASGEMAPVDGYSGTPAVWEMPLGDGKLCYCGPSLGWALSLAGKDFVALATALIHHLGGDLTEPQLVTESLRLGEGQGGSAGAGLSPSGQVGGFAADYRPKRPWGPPGPLPRGAQLVESDTEAPEINLTGSYSPARGGAEIFLSYWSPQTHAAVSLAPGRAVLQRVERGKVAGRVALLLPQAEEIPLVIKERRGSLAVWAGGSQATLPIPGLWEGKVAVRGAALSPLSVQPVEPVFASDDFMRTAGESDAWDVVCGQWSVPPRSLEMGANTFTYGGTASGVGWAATGYPHWDDYTLQASVKPTSAKGLVGLGIYFTDERNHLCFRSAVHEGTRRSEAGFEIACVRDGQTRVLARYPGGLLMGQWYRLAVRVQGERITASVDGRPIMVATNATFSGGKAALFVRNGSARFDDVLVQPSSLPLRVEGGLDAAIPHFAGIIDGDTWASPSTVWNADRYVDGLFWRRGVFYGDFDFGLRLPVAGDAVRSPAPDGGPVRLTLLFGDGVGTDSGYAFAVRRTGRAGDAWTYRAAFLRKGVVVAEGSATGPAEPMVRLQRSRGNLIGWVEGYPVVRFTDPDLRPQGRCIGFQTEGARPRLSTVMLRADHVFDYTFDQAPTDWWAGSGVWEVTSRWSCTPSWAWFSGVSSEVAGIWNKHGFDGDIALDYYVGPRMVPLGGGRIQEVTRALNCVICGDGHAMTSGYSFEVGVEAAGGAARLIRKGQVVATNQEFGFATAIHNRWLNVRAEKRGAEIGLWVEGQRVLHWVDPSPLRGGYAGIWTRDNGIMVPRVTLYYEALSGRTLFAP